MKKLLLTFIVLFWVAESNGQSITVQDTVFMHKLSVGRVRGFLSLLNLVANVDIDEASRQYTLDNSFAKNSTNRIFLSEDAIIEDDIDPSRTSYLKKADKKVSTYLSDFNLQVAKTGGDTIPVKFTNIRHSNVKKADLYYMKVFYDTEINSRRKGYPTDPPYQKTSRVAEIRFEKPGNTWLAYITRVAFQTPDDTDPAKVSLNDVEVTQIAQVKSEEDEKAEKANQEAQRHIAEYRKLIQEADELLNKGRNQEAIEVYSKARPLAYGDVRADQGIARARESIASKKENHALFARNFLEDMKNSYARRRYEEALVAGQQALTYKPDDQETLKLMNEISDKKRVKDNLNERFDVCKTADDYKNLYDEYRKLSRKDEKNPDWFWGMGRCELAAKDLKGATSNLKKALDMDPTFEQALLTRAELNEAKNDLAGAVADLEKYATIRPKEAMVFSRLGQYRARLGNGKKALENFNQSVDLEPSNVHVIYNRGLFFEQTGDYEAAREDYTDIVRKNGELLKEALVHRGYTLVYLKKIKDAGNDFAKAKTLNLDDKAALSKIDSISQSFFHEGAALAERSITALKEQKPADDAARKNTADAFAALSNSIYVKKDNADAWFWKGKLYSAQLNFTQAIADGYNQAVQYSPDDYLFLYNRGVAFFNQDKFDEALKDFTGAYEKNNTFYFALSYRGVTLMSLKDYEAARTNFLTIREQEKRLLKVPGYMDNKDFFAELHNSLGRCEYELGGEENYKKAVESLKASIEYNPNDYPQAYYYMGKALYGLRKPDKAVAQYQKALSVGSSNTYFKKLAVYEDLGQALTDLRKYTDASAAYSDMIGLAPTRIQDFVLRRGNCYFLAGNYDLALKDFDFVYDKDSTQHGEFLLMGGIAAANMKMSDKAIHYLGKFLRADQNVLKSAQANFSLGCAWLQKNNEKAASSAFESAFKLPEFKAIYKRDKLENLLKLSQPTLADSKDFKKKYLN